MKRRNELKNYELASFCRQTALLFHAGITPAGSINILLKDTKDKKAKNILEEILGTCEQGEHFHKALEETNVFPSYLVSMVLIGEESGTLDQVMSSLADYYEREEDISDHVKSAITYPAIMIFMMLVVVFALVTKVLPIFSEVFKQLGSEMTGFAKTLLVLGQLLNRYLSGIIIFLVILVIAYLFCSKTRRGKIFSRCFFSNFPMTRGFFQKLAVGKFANAMTLALGSGLDTYAGLDMATRVVEHHATRKRIATCKESLIEGYNLAEALALSGIFSNLYTQMIAVGFQTGTTDQVMKNIAKSYERETEKRLQSILSIIEPTLVIVLSVIVGLILLSVILPLMGVMTSIG